MIGIKNSGVFAIESLWSSNLNEQRQSIEQVLYLLKCGLGDFNYAVLNCNTIEELEHSLDIAKQNSSKFRVLYFGSHGEPYSLNISLSNKTFVSLDKLAEMMGTRFGRWAVHFGSCSTLKADHEHIKRFMDRTKVKMLTGYTKDVDWMESSAFEVLFFSYLYEGYTDLDKFRKLWYNKFPELSNLNGFSWYLKGD